MALDQATTALLEQMKAANLAPLTEQTPAEARGRMAAMRGEQPAGPEMSSVRNTRVRVSGGYVSLRILTPAEHPRGLVVYLHGGGWVIGGNDDYDRTGRLLAQGTGCTVVLVDYRLAPEYRFPVAVDDSWAALLWAQDHKAELTGDAAAPLIVAGDSAGGNLAAIMCQRARAAGGPDIALQVLIYPATDSDTDSVSYRDPANQLMLTRESMIWFWDHYVPDPAARIHPEAAPLRATDLSRLPPAAVLTAEHDVLRDEGELYATRLLKSGVPVKHKRFAGQMHGFFTMEGILPGATEAMDYVVAVVEEHLAPERAAAVSGAASGAAAG
jgi:acetyl esterase